MKYQETEDELENAPRAVGTLHLPLFLLLAYWALKLIAMGWKDGEAMTFWLHNVNLAFHEFGHLLFSPLGQWMMFIGGSFFQCCVPLGLAYYFTRQRPDPAGQLVSFWWAGQNLHDLAPYIGDARALALPLIGEWNDEVAEMRADRHDWHNILSPLGMLPLDHALANLAFFMGSIAMLVAAGFGLYLSAKPLLKRKNR